MIAHHGRHDCIAQVLAIIYFGVTVSDMVTFYIGVALRTGFFKSMKNNLFRCWAVSAASVHCQRKRQSVPVGHSAHCHLRWF